MKTRELRITGVDEIRPFDRNKGRLLEILRTIAGRKVLVVGDVGVDRYTMGTVERISPEAPVPVVLVEEERLKLGLAANVADNVKTLGGIPFLLGLIGNDRGASDLRRLLRRSRIDGKHLVVDRSRRTVLKDRVVSERQQLLRVDYESAHFIDSAVEQQLVRRLRGLVGSVDAVILEDYAKGVFSNGLAHQVCKMAKKAGVLVAVDPNMKASVDSYRGATVLTPNTKEAEKLTGIAINDTESMVRAGCALLKAAKARHVVITRGKEGMAIFSVGSSSVRLIPTYAREVYDVSGAGDTVISVLALALSAGATIVEAAVLGNMAAGVEVAKRGTATVSREEIQVALEFFDGIGA
jgi:D-glycero-beta-D-manno-heptose-7-phosphate kinase